MDKWLKHSSSDKGKLWNRLFAQRWGHKEAHLKAGIQRASNWCQENDHLCYARDSPMTGQCLMLPSQRPTDEIPALGLAAVAWINFSLQQRMQSNNPVSEWCGKPRWQVFGPQSGARGAERGNFLQNQNQEDGYTKEPRAEGHQALTPTTASVPGSCHCPLRDCVSECIWPVENWPWLWSLFDHWELQKRWVAPSLTQSMLMGPSAFEQSWQKWPNTAWYWDMPSW